jgi:integrase/recombinase XerD
MTLRDAITWFKQHQRANLKPRTQQSYHHLLQRLESCLGDRLFEAITPEDLYRFLDSLTEHAAKSTRRLRYAQTKALWSLLIEQGALSITNPCCAPLLAKSFKIPKRTTRTMLDKETVDEMIYNAHSLRDRLVLELQARCGLRIGEILSLKAGDVSDRKLLLHAPKSGKEQEVAFMPEHVAKRLEEYLGHQAFAPGDRLFPICYSTARALVRRYGEKLNVCLSPHDLRRHSATYASRNGVPLEIISKVILRHQDLKTTQMYLGKVTDTEAIRWMDTLHER